MADTIDKPKDRRGPPIWVESLMTSEEYREYARKYSKTCCPGCAKVANFNNPKHGRWRWRMGGGYTTEEIIAMNHVIDNLHLILEEVRRKIEEMKEKGEKHA